MVLAAAGKTDPKDTEFVLAVVGETDPENSEMVLADGESDPEDAESVRSLAVQVRVQESLDRLSLIRLSHLFRIQIIHPWVLDVLTLLVHVLRVLLVLCTRVALCHPCMHIIRGRTRLAYRVPKRGGVPKRELPVQPKTCVLSQRWRLG